MPFKLLLLSVFSIFTFTSQCQTVDWAFGIGGGGADNARAVATDASGNVYCTGRLGGDNVDFDPGPGVTTASAGGFFWDIFLAKYDQNGAFLWVHNFGNSEYLEGSSVETDNAGNVYITGQFKGTVDFNPGTGVNNLTSANGDIFIAKFAPNGDYIWAKSFVGGPSTSSEPYTIQIDASADLYIGGFFTSVMDFDPGPSSASLTSFGSADMFICKLDSSGSFNWVKRMGGTGAEQIIDMKLDPSGNIYMTGFFQNTTDFDPSPSTFNLTANGVSGHDIVVGKYSPTGDLIWVKQMGGTNNDNGRAVSVDASGNVYAAGYFYGTVDFDPGVGISNLTANGSSDVFMVKFDNSGNHVWSKSVGGTQSDYVAAIVNDASSNVYVFGTYENSVDFDPGAGANVITSNGNRDVFFLKLNASGDYVWAESLGSTNDEFAEELIINSNDELLGVSKYTATLDLDFGPGTITASHGGNEDFFVIKINQCTITSSTDTEIACNTYTWIDGNTYTSSNNSATYTLTNAAGCDSVVTLDLTINNSNTGTDTQIACDTYTWIDGNTYTSSNNSATHTLTNAAGCDSVVTLDLTMNNSNTGTDAQIACDTYTWIDGNTYTSSNNSATHTLTNAAGCDSVVTLDLTINNSNTGTDTQIACDSYTWIDGNTYTSSNNSASHTLTNAAGCDSVVTLDLTINNSNTGIDTQSACDTYTWIDGNTYTSSNNSATYTLTNAAGCDSVVTLDLTINNSNTGTDTQIACDTYTWIDGNIYTSSNNSATYTLTNAAGCDSVVTLDLTINSVDNSITQISQGTLQANAIGAIYQWIDCATGAAVPSATGQTYVATSNGSFAVLVTENGCSDTSVCLTTSGIGLAEIETNDFVIYPNPADEFIQVDFIENAQNHTLKIVDMKGKVVLEKEYHQQTIVVPTRDLEEGVYVLSVSNEIGILKKRFVISR